MRTAIDDCPHVGVSRLRAVGLIGADDKTTVHRFPTHPPAPTLLTAPDLRRRRHSHPFPQRRRLVLFPVPLRSPCPHHSASPRLPRLQALSRGQRLPLPGRGSVSSRARRFMWPLGLAARLAAAEAGAHARLKPHLRYSALEAARPPRRMASFATSRVCVAYRHDFRDLIPKAKAGGD